MEARKLSASDPPPIELSLRIRHPAIDPKEITDTLGLEPEHCFKAGDSRTSRGSRVSGQHTQSYWLAPISPDSVWADPIEPEFLGEIAAKGANRQAAVSVQRLQAVAPYIRSRSVEGLLLLFLHRLNARHSYLQSIQAGGGDVSLIIAVDRESAADFTLPVNLARLLVQLGISIEFRFDQ